MNQLKKYPDYFLVETCPFCGGDAKVMKEVDGCGFYLVTCENCESKTTYDTDISKVVNIWNKRYQKELS